MNYLDSRDLLSELRDLLGDSSYDYDDDPREATVEAWAKLDEFDRERVEALREVLSELPERTTDGVGLGMIPEDEFEDYARDFAEDIGAINDNTSWPFTCIDWTKAATALAQDFTRVDFDGTTYLCR